MTAQRACDGTTSLTSSASVPDAASVPTAPGRHTQRSDREIIHHELDRLPRFRDVPRSIQPLPGGLTNRIYKVTAPGQSVVARIASGKSALLAIDRRAECANAYAAAEAGAGPKVLWCEPDQGVSIVEWIEGKTYVPEDLDDTDRLARVAGMCRVLHQGPRFANDFDMFEVQRYYLEVVARLGFRLPADYLDFDAGARRIRGALGVQSVATVPCHNDLLAANIMDDGERIWFIDYEYSGNNDPCFELGNVWSESNLPLDRLDELVDTYYGFHSPAMIARARLLAVMSKYGWMLWAAIQDAVSDVEFDFWSWGMEKYERAVAEFDAPEFSRLIEDVQQPN
ncbi:MAG: choline kinase family protein [Actinomycetota bacterium]|nr:choline kinase family protein [Actinomycetota bacterium]